MAKVRFKSLRFSYDADPTKYHDSPFGPNNGPTTRQRWLPVYPWSRSRWDAYEAIGDDCRLEIVLKDLKPRSPKDGVIRPHIPRGMRVYKYWGENVIEIPQTSWTESHREAREREWSSNSDLSPRAGLDQSTISETDTPNNGLIHN